MGTRTRCIAVTLALAVTVIVAAGSPAWGQAAGRASQHPAMPGPGHGTMGHSAAAPMDQSTSRWSEHHAYRVSYEATPSPPPLNTVHAWTLTITDASGRAVEGARVSVAGGMPAHDHGLPTSPQVSSLGGGRYRLQGLKFHMPGAWVVKLTIATPASTDAVTFNLKVE